MESISFLFIALAVVALFYMSSRNRKQQRKAMDFRSSLAPGQEVMTGSGLFGTVVAVDPDKDIITLESTPGGAQTRWLRAAIAKRIDPPVPDDAGAEIPDDADDAEEVPGETGAAQRGIGAAFGSPTSINASKASGDLPADLVIPDDISSLTGSSLTDSSLTDSGTDSGRGAARDDREDDGTDSTNRSSK